MKYTVVFTNHAARELKRLCLSGIHKRLVFKALDSLARDPYRGYPLRKELKGFYKLRVGNYRIVYEIKRRTVTVIVVGIGHRKNVYDTLSRRVRMT